MKNVIPFLCCLCCLAAMAQAQDNSYKNYLQLSYSELDSLMYIHYDAGAADKALVLMQAGQAKARIDFGEQDSVFAEYTNNIGFFYDNMGKYELALQYYTQAKDIRAKVLGKENPAYAGSLNNIAYLHHNQGNYPLALALYTEAKDIQEKTLGKEHIEFATSINNLAALLREMGDYESALTLYIQSSKIQEKVKGKDHPDFAMSLNNMAILHKNMGNYALALPLYMQAKDIREKSQGKDHLEFANALINIAMLHSEMNNEALALPLLEQAKDIYERSSNDKPTAFATLLNNFASLHESMGKYDLALSFCTQAQKLYEGSVGKEHPLLGNTLMNIARLHSNQRDYPAALSFSLRAKDIFLKAFGGAHHHSATTLNSIASIHIHMKNRPAALAILSEAFGYCSNLPIRPSFSKSWADSMAVAPYPSYSQIEKMTDLLSTAYVWLGSDTAQNIDKQQIVANLVIQLLNRARNEVANESDKLRILSQNDIWLQRNLNHLLKPDQDSQAAFSLADQNKSVLLLQATKSERQYQLGELPDSLVWKNKQLQTKQSQLQAKLNEKRSEQEKDSLRNELNHINREIGAFQLLLKQKHPKYYKLKYEQIDAKVANIQALLPPHAALLEYVLTDSFLHVFYIDKKSINWHKLPIAKAVLANQIKSLHQALSDYEGIKNNPEKAYQNYSTSAFWAYQQLLAPVLKGKQDINKLIIVTDGELGHLPFETFLVEAAPAAASAQPYQSLHYLLNDYQISYNYSATLWKENIEAAKVQNNGEILAMAADYGTRTDSSLSAIRTVTDQWLRSALSPLPAARREVELLQEKYLGYFAFGRDASEKNIKAKAGDFAILHLATHGILDVKNPMLSSLAFSEDNDSIESNFWQAHEISSMELKADLVVLSACQTGFGRFEQGNGIASLARAFMYAGASALVVSLWEVNDASTGQLMAMFYANLAKGKEKDDALQLAKIQYIQSSKGAAAHPAFWSPFVMMGNTAPVAIKTKTSNWLYWSIGGLGAVLLVLLVGYKWRKGRG